MIRSDPLASIGFRSGIHYRYLLSDVAALLKQRHGSAIHVFCATPQDAKHYRNLNQDGQFDSITVEVIPHRVNLETDLDREVVVAESEAWEERLGITMNSLIMGNRHLGRSYSLGGFYNPRSRFSESVNYIQALHGFNKTLEFWERHVTEKKISLALNTSKELAVTCRLLGVLQRSLSSSGYEGYHFWGENEYFEYSAFEKAYHVATGSKTAEINKPYVQAMATRSRALEMATAFSLVRDLARYVAQHAYGRIRGYDKAKEHILWQVVKWRSKVYLDLNSLASRQSVTLEELGDSPFVFYPLHEEPETTLTVGSPEYFNQMQAIATLSRDLPAGVLLAVKETPYGVGRRPDNFYDQITEFKNVVWLDMPELGPNVVRKAAAVATIAGTAGFEAAVMGKPVISFGRHNVYNFLPHVFVVHSEDELAAHLRAALAEDFDGERAKADGARFLEAVVTESFDLFGYDYINVRDYEQKAVENAYGGLLRSLSIERRDESLRKAG